MLEDDVKFPSMSDFIESLSSSGTNKLLVGDLLSEIVFIKISVISEQSRIVIGANFMTLLTQKLEKIEYSPDSRFRYLGKITG